MTNITSAKRMFVVEIDEWKEKFRIPTDDTEKASEKFHVMMDNDSRTFSMGSRRIAKRRFRDSYYLEVWDVENFIFSQPQESQKDLHDLFLERVDQGKKRGGTHKTPIEHLVSVAQERWIMWGKEDIRDGKQQQEERELANEDDKHSPRKGGLDVLRKAKENL